MSDKPDRPIPDTNPDTTPGLGPDRTDLARAIARQRSGRRIVAVAATVLAAALVTAACGTADASPRSDRSAAAGYSVSGGHAGHGSAAGSTDTDADQTDGEETGDDAEVATGRNNGRGNGDRTDGDRSGDRNGDRPDRNNGDRGKDRGNQNAGNNNGNGNNNGSGNGNNNNGLDVLGRDCSTSDLPPHTGFQVSPACVDTAFGEVAAADKSPSLLITEAPTEVKVGESFTLKVSTRNLVRDRFLGAAAGGYYLESSFLDDNGIQRGHFHTACRVLPSLDEAPDSAPDPEFFLATQDNKGGAGVDTVEIEVPGIDEAGVVQCTSWAGDGSHRIPMMQRANQTPAVDSVRITVK